MASVGSAGLTQPFTTPPGFTTEATSDALLPIESNQGRRALRWQDVVPIAIVVALFVVGFILLLIPQTRSNLFELLTWAHHSGPLAVSVYSVVFIVSVLIGLPSVVFVVAAGFTFKWYAAFFSVWIGGIIGGALVFVIGRTFIKTSLETLCWHRTATLKEVQRLMSDPQTGWKWALLIRLPYIPYPQMSYALSATDISFAHYMITSAVGSMPGIFAYVYLGAGIKNLKAYLNGKEGLGLGSTMLQLGAAVFSVATFTALALVARRRVNAHARQSIS